MRNLTTMNAKILYYAIFLGLTFHPALINAQEAGTNLINHSDFNFNIGADFRVRQEIMDNIPGNPGSIYSLLPVKRSGNANHVRFRPRIWFELENGPFKLYTRFTDEFREHIVKNGVRKKDRSYNFPDEILLDNLYLEGKGLEFDFLRPLGVEKVDFRVGRQDLINGAYSIFGLERIISEGTPLDGSRSFFADMVRSRFYFDETSTLDAFALYCNGQNNLRWGSPQSKNRALNPLNMADTNEMDEWGGGLVYSGIFGDDDLAFKAYSVFKRSEAYTTKIPNFERRMSPKEITTLGVLLNPKFNDYWSMEIEGAKQFGRILDGNKQAGGFMGHVVLNYRPKLMRSYSPIVSWATTYYSGDKNRTNKDDNDTSWDPMWARATQESELLVYGSLYGNCYWSNMIYSKLKLSMSFGKQHGFFVYTGPMFTAVQDRLGHEDGSGKSMYKGWLSAACYEFPIRLAPDNASGIDRLEIFGHIIAETFQPGDYFDTSKPSYFFRWEISIKF